VPCAAVKQDCLVTETCSLDYCRSAVEPLKSRISPYGILPLKENRTFPTTW